MSSCSLVNVIQTFPWNISRHIYIAPNLVQGVRVSGVSFDWEFLLTSAFVDAKIIIKEWLILRRIYPHKDDMDFSDLNLIPSTEFRRKVLARACLFEDYEFYELISKAYLYMVALYEEEQDYLAVFIELQYAVDMRDNNTSTHTTQYNTKSPSLLANPDWVCLARWLKRAVLVDLQSSPALLAATALSSVGDGADAFSLDVARRLLHEHFISNDPSECELHHGGKSQLLGSLDAGESIPTGRLSLQPPSVLALRHSETSSDRRDLQTDSGNVSGMKRTRVQSEGSVPLTAADSSRQQLQVHNATDATMQHYQQLQQQQQQLLYQNMYTSAAMSSYRDNPNQQTTGLRSCMTMPTPLPSSHSHSVKEPTGASMVQGLGTIHTLPQQHQQHRDAASAHLPAGALDGKTDTRAAGSQFTVPFPPQAVLGSGGLAGYYVGNNGAFPYYSTSPFLGAAAGTHALHLVGGGELPRSSNNTTASYVQMGKAAAVPAEAVGPSWNWPTPQQSSPLMQGRSEHTSMTTQAPPPPMPLPLLLQPGSSAAELWSQAGNSGLHSHSSGQSSAGMGPPSFPRSQSGAVLSHSSSAASLRPILSTGILGMGMSRPQTSSNSSGVGSISASPQPPLSMLISNPFAVNRRQKKNRDKFRVTFQFSMARAAELQRQHGLAMDPIPHLTEAADSHNSNTSKVTTGDMHYSLLVALKGIDVLPNGRYRVQLNTFMNGKKKFSRNSTDLYEALWIFEIALLISDSPSLLSELQRIGNYNCLAPLGHLGLFASPREYYLELGRHILLFYDTVDFFNEDLISLAIHNYNAMKPAVTPMPPSLLQQPALYSAPQTHRVNVMTDTAAAVGLSSTVSNEDSEDEGLYPNTDVSAPVAPVSVSVFRGRPNLHTSHAEAVAPISWMGGFNAGLSLQEQQLSALFCLRSLAAPSWMPRMSMVKEDKPSQPTVHTIAATTTTDTATAAEAAAVNTTPIQP